LTEDGIPIRIGASHGFRDYTSATAGQGLCWDESASTFRLHKKDGEMLKIPIMFLWIETPFGGEYRRDGINSGRSYPKGGN